jgi:hypothetical protein
MALTTKLSMVLVLLVSALVQTANAAPSPRTSSIGYDGPNGIVISSATDGLTISTVQSGKIEVLPGERFVSATITDDSGQPVAAEVHQGGADLGLVCGKGAEELTLVTKKPVHLHLLFGASTDCAGVSVPSTGTIELSFSR